MIGTVFGGSIDDGRGTGMAGGAEMPMGPDIPLPPLPPAGPPPAPSIPGIDAFWPGTPAIPGVVPGIPAGRGDGVAAG